MEIGFLVSVAQKKREQRGPFSHWAGPVTKLRPACVQAKAMAGTMITAHITACNR